MRGRLKHSGGVVAEAGRALMARRRGEGALGGGCADEGWARGKKLTSGPWLPARGSGARGRGEALTGGARVSAGGSRARVGPPGPGREEGKCGRARVGPEFGPAEGGGSFSFSFSNSNSFLLLFLFLFLFYSFSLETKNIF